MNVKDESKIIWIVSAAFLSILILLAILSYDKGEDQYHECQRLGGQIVKTPEGKLCVKIIDTNQK